MHDNEIEQLRQEDLAREARARLTMPELIPPRPERAATYWLRFKMRGGVTLDGPCKWDPTDRTWAHGWGGGTKWSAEYTKRSGVTIASDIPIPDPEGLEAIRAVVAALSEHVRLMEAVMGPAKPEWQIAGGHNITAGQVTAAAQALGL